MFLLVYGQWHFHQGYEASVWDLSKMGHENVAYIDDSLLQGDSYEQCMNNIIDTMKLIDSFKGLYSLGLTIHPVKSIMCLLCWILIKFS